MATQVTMEDGREGPLDDHLREAHQKGTRGFTEDYLDTMHRDLHERKREPEEELEHRHPDAQNAHSAQDTHNAQDAHFAQDTQNARNEQNARNQQNARSEGDPYRPDEQPTSGAMTMKQREHTKPRNSESGNGQHRDRYAPQSQQSSQHSSQQSSQHSSQGADQAQSRESQEQFMSGVPGQRTRDPEEMQGAAAGNGASGNQAGNKKNGKHRKNRH